MFLARGQWEAMGAKAKATKVHPDSSKVKVRVKKKAQHSRDTDSGVDSPVVTVLEYSADIDPDQLEQLNTERKRALEELKGTLKHNIKELLKDDMGILWKSEFENRVPVFQQWYFRYQTQYDLMGKGVRSFLAHSMAFNRPMESVSDLVMLDMQIYIEKKYELLILQPEISDWKIRKVLQKAYKQLESEYVQGVQEVNSQFRRGVFEKCGKLIPVAGEDELEIVLDGVKLDWEAQLNKVKHISGQFERSPKLLALLSGAVSSKASSTAVAAGTAAATGAAGSVAAKTAAGSATVAAKVVAPAASKALASKLATPFLAKLTAFLAGPPTGVAVAVVVDCLLSKGLAFMSADDFRAEVGRILEATREEYLEACYVELDRVVDEELFNREP
ncbi:unnamed protein product [Prorocentrum cordatum]|nr:unnamed protein product [Polarella glacialis]